MLRISALTVWKSRSSELLLLDRTTFAGHEEHMCGLKFCLDSDFQAQSWRAEQSIQTSGHCEQERDYRYLAEKLSL